jgi:uncharacterized protein (DUF2062 family)
VTSLDRPDSGSSASRPIGIAAIAGAAFASAVVAVLMATLTIATSRPSDHELQRAAAQEIGVPTVLFRVPGVQALVDEVSDRVAGRVIVESKPSIGLGVVVGLLSGALAAVASATALGRFVQRRRQGRRDTRSNVT